METSHTRLQQHFFLFMLLIVGIIMFFIFRPFISALVLAVSLALVFGPVYRRLVRKFNGRENLAALATVALTILVVLIPLLFLGGLLFDEAQNLYRTIAEHGGGSAAFSNIVVNAEMFIENIAPDVTIDVAAYAEYGLRWVLTHLDSFFTGFFQVLLALFIMVISLFYILRDGAKLRSKFVSLSPLSNHYDEQILGKLSGAINSVIKGSLIIAIMQGILAALGVWIFGLPNPIIWGLCATIASLVPGFGTAIVMIPAVVYLFVVARVPAAIGLLLWQGLIVGLVDNVARPYLMNRDMNVHPLLILLSVLGGIAFFGPIGFILGPIVLAFLFALLDIYPLIVKPADDSANSHVS